MLKVTRSSKSIQKTIISHPCLVRMGQSVFMTIPCSKDQALKYDNWERDAVVLVGTGKDVPGTFIKALNLEECEFFEGTLKLENEKS